MSTNTTDWARLTAPVPVEDLEYLPKAGKQLAYMTAQFVRRRLDSVLLGRWSYDVKPIHFSDGQPAVGDGEPFAVVGTITLLGNETGGLSRSSIGSGKNFKEAETDAFKRAAQRLGIGNELYEMGAQPAVPQRPAAPAQGLTDADKAVMREAATAQAIVKTVSNESVPCPKCGGKTWDERPKKKNPKAPDFRCRDKEGCGGVIWPSKETAAPVAATAGKPWADGEDDLAF